MRSWLKLMPWFLVVWFARQYCERFTENGELFMVPFKGGPKLSVKNVYSHSADKSA